MDNCPSLRGKSESTDSHSVVSLAVKYETLSSSSEPDFERKNMVPQNLTQDDIGIHYGRENLFMENEPTDVIPENDVSESKLQGPPQTLSSSNESDFERKDTVRQNLPQDDIGINDEHEELPTVNQPSDVTVESADADIESQGSLRDGASGGCTSEARAPSSAARREEVTTAAEHRDQQAPRGALQHSTSTMAPLPSNSHLAPSHFLNMIKELREDESQTTSDDISDANHDALERGLANSETKNSDSSDEDEFVDFRAIRNKKVKEVMLDEGIKAGFDKVSNDCTSLFKILNTLTISEKQAEMNKVTQEKVMTLLSSTSAKLAKTKTKYSSVINKALVHNKQDKNKRSFHEFSIAGQTKFETHLERKVQKSIQFNARNFKRTKVKSFRKAKQDIHLQKYKPRTEHIQFHLQNTEKHINDKNKRNIYTLTGTTMPIKMREESRNKDAHNIEGTLENSNKCFFKLVRDRKPIKVNALFLCRSKAIYENMSKENVKKETFHKIKDAGEKVHRNEVQTKSQLRPEAREKSNQTNSDASETIGDILRSGKIMTNKALLNFRPKLHVSQEVPKFAAKTLAFDPDGDVEGEGWRELRAKDSGGAGLRPTRLHLHLRPFAADSRAARAARAGTLATTRLREWKKEVTRAILPQTTQPADDINTLLTICPPRNKFIRNLH